jgi:precorrin-6B C5,15-methyltransferase / cobalt-precorrin-6B C5,C15-methyltransferase
VGIGADGWLGLPESARDLVSAGDVVYGSDRQLALVPERPGQSRRAWPRPLHDGLAAMESAHPGQCVVVLASGDPTLSGIATTLRAFFDDVEIHPAVSSVALARARMRWSAEESEVVTVVGRRVEAVARQLAPGRSVVVLSADASTPAEVAGLLVEHGYGDSRMTVLADLGSPGERRFEATAATWTAEVPALNVIALELVGPVVGSWVAGLPDDAFEHDGQLTKRDLRAAALARLMPQPGQLLWDVGAGAGSVGIEWMRAHPTCAAVAVEADNARADRIARNAARLGVPALRVVVGRAPEALDQLPRADAVFVGGGATRAGVLDACLAALRSGGRLVVHGVTLETERVLGERYAEHGGELTRISVEHAAPVGSFTGWTPARSVTQWAMTR